MHISNNSWTRTLFMVFTTLFSLSCAQSTVHVPPLSNRIHTKTITQLPAYDFSFELPSGWQAQYIKEIEAINVYNAALGSKAPGPGANLEKSEIFIRHFRASKFLILSTVNIISREETTRAGRPAVNYVIEKKRGVSNFASQPAWRNLRHRVLDIRVSDSSPSEFYVFAKRPDLPDEVFEKFLNSLQFGPEKAAIHEPIKNFTARVTKKPFGIFVTPTDSPVSPERFSGYHTGADFETIEGEQSKEIPVRAVADGKVLRSGSASGYGGMVAIEHIIDGQRIVGIYGHLDPKNLASVGTAVKGGAQIGILGDGKTPETDFERKHLHLSLYKGAGVNVAGYVSKKSALKEWIDLTQILKENASH